MQEILQYFVCSIVRIFCNTLTCFVARISYSWNDKIYYLFGYVNKPRWNKKWSFVYILFFPDYKFLFTLSLLFSSPTDLIESNLSNWDAVEEAQNNPTTGGNNTANPAATATAAASNNECWETEKSIPLLFALLTRYVSGTDRLRCNAFEVRDATGNSSSGVIHCADAYSLTSWVKCITDVILGLNNVQVCKTFFTEY